MSPLDRLQRRKPARAARGFTFVEIMVALALGLFLIGGLLTLVQAMRRTATNQSGMSQLQDNERMAMQLITDVVQSTGYYTSPLTNSAATAPAATVVQTASPWIGPYPRPPGGPPWVAVLPLQDLDNAPFPRHISDGIVADIVCQLAGLRELRVISHGSTLGLRDTHSGLRDIGQLALVVRAPQLAAIERADQVGLNA